MDILTAPPASELISSVLSQRPLYISGPCSAETEEQVIATARALKLNTGIHIFRAGIWKPRTRPGNFEGVGSIGLEWLLRVKEETGLPVAIEVASARQVEESIRAGIDMLWIGARTTVNPFSVQDVADALKGVKIPVFVKNPLNPDIDLWTGAVERVLNAGIDWVGLIHRGFSSYGTTQYRNAPMWHLAIEMKQRHLDLPMLCDPSHICGNRTLIPETLQYAADLGYDGCMIESHIHPESAWSDAAQQLTPELLSELLQNIIWREKKFSSMHDKLVAFRQQIDQLDDELLTILGKRMQLSRQIGIYKSKNNISILQFKRWAEIMSRAFYKGRKMELSDEFIRNYFNAIHLESIRKQEEQMKSGSATNNDFEN